MSVIFREHDMIDTLVERNGNKYIFIDTAAFAEKAELTRVSKNTVSSVPGQPWTDPMFVLS